MKIKRILWLCLGCIGLALGALGAVLPLLPTVPFLLLAALGFAKAPSGCTRGSPARSFIKTISKAMCAARA